MEIICSQESVRSVIKKLFIKVKKLKWLQLETIKYA